MRKTEIRDLVFAAILIALIVVLTFSPLGYIQITGFASFTIIHIPVLVGAVLLGRNYGFILGIVFGIGSLIMASILLGGNAPFTNPLLSVVPRSFFGWIIYPIYLVIDRRIKKQYLSVLVTMIICTAIHSLIVIPLYYLFGATGFYFNPSETPFEGNATLLTIFTTIISVNTALEIVLAAVVGTPAVLVLKQLNKE